jgi:hypothetical protein
MSTRTLTFSGADLRTKALAVDDDKLVVDATTGKVGVGTTAPTESLDIVGNLNLQKVSNTASIKLNSNVVTEYTRSKKFIKYPRVAMTAATTAGYTASASGNFGSYYPWEVFDNNNPVGGNTGAGAGWASPIDADNKHYDPASGAFNLTTQHHTGSLEGEWIQIQIPEPIYLYDFVLESRSETSYGLDGYDNGYPKICELYASNDGSTWTSIRQFTTGQKKFSEQHIEQVNSTVAYKYYALVINTIQIVNNTTQVYWTSIGQIELHGTPEYDPEAHGTDVIMRSVPNVPNTDWLEVYWDAGNTSSYSGSGSTRVTDLSGNGVTGTITGTNGFDSTYNAWVFDGSGDYIESTLPSTFVDDQVHTVSLWFKRASNHDGTLFSIAPTSGETSSDSKVIQIRTNDSSGYTLSYIFWSNDLQYNPTIVDDTWYHLCGTYTGGGGTKDKKLLYLNGSLIEPTQENGTVTNVLDIDASSKIRLGSRINHASINYLDGSIANFRLFNRALTGDEVWQLYAYQKEYFDVSPDVVTFKGGRLGVGTSEPRAVLDVRGDTFSQKYNGGRSTFLTWDYLGSRSTSFAQPANDSGGTVASILDHEFNIPSCYHDLGTTTLKAYVKVDWRGEFNTPWNFLFRLKVYYNDYSSTYTLDSSMPDQSADNRGRGCGIPTVSYHNNNDSTPEAASVTSQFTLEQCQVSKGSKIKVELLGVYTDFDGGTTTLWTGRCTGSNDNLSYEMMISSFFVALDVV